jgi:hypothetical protein
MDDELHPVGLEESRKKDLGVETGGRASGQGQFPGGPVEDGPDIVHLSRSPLTGPGRRASGWDVRDRPGRLSPTA